MHKFDLNKGLFAIGFSSYIVLAVLSIVFYLERAAFVDLSFHLFYILKDGDFAIQNNRFVAFITQLFPLLGAKAGLGLEVVMKSYSIGFILLYLSVFLVLTVLLKQARHGLLMLLLSVIMVTHTFYWAQSEFPQGLAILVLYFGVLHYAGVKNDYLRKWWFLPTWTLFLFILVFTHPLLFFPFGFLTLFFILHFPHKKKLYMSSGITFIGLYGLKSIFFKTAYDSGSMHGLNNFITLFPNYFSLESNLKFVKYLVNDYYMIGIFLLVSIGYYIAKRKYLKLGLLMSFFFGYLLLINVSYPNGTDQFYIENLYLPLSIFIGAVMAFDLVDMVTVRTAVFVLSIIILIRLIDIISTHRIYTDRIEYLLDYIELTEHLPQKKLIVDEKLMSIDTLLMSWATPYEFWLLSTVKTGQTRSIVITENPQSLEWNLANNKTFVTKWGSFDYTELPEAYFALTDTTYYQLKK